MPDTDIITASHLARLVGTPEAPRILDVRTDKNFAADPRTLPAIPAPCPPRSGAITAASPTGRPAPGLRPSRSSANAA
ncbi:hypothetical protein ACFQS7_26465 [Dankookia sp. GCM10030260]|uniref:hypothetical protein n=1 Tax=Dankookia sp. GCM10030260 TaxID=3273390 RepID=UPI0036086400